MRLLIRSISLAVITGFTLAAVAQTTENDATDSEASSLLEEELTYEEQKAEEKKEQNFQRAKRCLGVIAVPGDITMTRNQVNELPLELEAVNLAH